MEQCLRHINYYRLSAYWYPYRETELRDGALRRLNKFQNNTCWEDVWAHYLFDRKLRGLLFDAISRIEIALRTQLAYQWAQVTRMDSPQSAYNNYSRSFRAAEFLTKVNDYYQRSGADCAIHHRVDKGIAHARDLPIWVFVELTTFGNLSNLMSNGLKTNVLNLIAREFGFESKLAFASALSLLREVRNACAHHERIWNCRWMDSCPVNSIAREIGFATPCWKTHPLWSCER